MIEKSYIFYVIYLNHVHILKSVIFQEVLNILYFKIIPTISQKFDSKFGGPKLAHTLYSPFDLYSALMTVKPWRLYSLPHLLWHRTSVLNYHPKTRDTHTCCWAFGSGAVTWPDKIMSKDEVQTDIQTDRQIDRQTNREMNRKIDRQTERQGETNLPPSIVVCGE